MTFARLSLVQKHTTTDFSDLEGDLDAVAIAEPEKSFLQASVDLARNSPATGQPCPRCRATGRAFGGVCFRCNGTKYVSAASVKRGASDAAKRLEAERALVDRISQFSVEHAEVMGYCGRVQNDFTANCLRQLKNEGTMSQGRLDAIYKSLKQASDAKAAREVAAPSMAGAGFEKLITGFEHAAAAGRKRPKMICGEYVFKLATAVSNNPGFLYVYKDRAYMGKISPAGKLIASHDASATTIAEITEIGRDPFAAAVSHGRLTGKCSICGRELTDPKSIAAAIGPTCAKGMGW